MTSCYYCTEFDSEENWCGLYQRQVSEDDSDCDYFEFDTGIDEEEKMLSDEDIEWKDKDEQLDRTMDQLGRLSKLSNQELKAKVESLDKHRKRST